MVFLTDLLNKILRVVLKTKFDIETIGEKFEQLDQKMTMSQTKDNISYEMKGLDFIDLLPIKNDDQLTEIDDKLSTFRSSLVST